jgi:RNase P/RNase MRP subunit p29
LLQTDVQIERVVFSNRTDDSIVSITGRVVKFNRTTLVMNFDVEALIDIGNDVEVNWMFFNKKLH